MSDAVEEIIVDGWGDPACDWCRYHERSEPTVEAIIIDTITRELSVIHRGDYVEAGRPFGLIMSPPPSWRLWVTVGREGRSENLPCQNQMAAPDVDDHRFGSWISSKTDQEG